MSRRAESPPPTKSPLGRRHRGTGKLVLRPKDGPYGHDTAGHPLWKFLFRLGSRSRVIAAHDWREADQQAGTVFAEWGAERDAPRPQPGAGRTVDDLCDAFLASRGGVNSRTRPSTVAGYAQMLQREVRPSLGHLGVGAVTPSDVTDWQRRHDGGKSRTRQRRTILLSMLFRYAVELEWRATSPVRREHRVTVLKEGDRKGKLRGDQRVGVALTAEELDQITDALDAPDDLLVRLTAWSGLRASEVTHLRVVDVGPRGETLTVASDVACSCRDCAINGGERQTKSGRARIVPVAPELRALLLAYLTARSGRFGPDGWLFCRWFRPTRGRHAAGGQRLRKDMLAAFQRAADSAGLADRRLRFHDLRNTAHTWLTERSRGHLVAVSVALGHRLPGMAETYNRLAADPVALARALFPDSTPAKLQLVS